MAGRMEDLLMMGSDSDSDADEVKVGDADVVTQPAVVPAATNLSSKSELTNRLKNLYSSSSPPKGGHGGAPPPNPIAAPPPRNIPPTMNVARTGGPSSSHNPNYVPPMVHNQHHHNDPAAPSQQQPPPLVGIGRVPAPLPTARTKIIPRNPTIQPSPMTASSASSRQPYTTSAQSLPRQQAQQTPNPIMAATDHSSNSSRSSVQGSLTQAEQEKKEKERFLMFIRVLMK